MNYSTLKEAWDIDTFDKEKRTKSKSKSEKKLRNDYNDLDKKLEKFEIHKKTEETEETEENDVIIVPKKVNNITPFYDKDLEKYLDINDTSPKIEKDIEDENTNLTNKVVENFQNIEVINTNRELDNIQNNEIEKLKKKNQNNKMYINIFLFLFIGIVIIFICEQITEIAINIGMKSCIKILKPYLDNNDIKNI